MKVLTKDRSILPIAILICLFTVENLYGSDNVIVVFFNRELGRVNKKVFGNNIRANDPAHQKKRYDISDYGLGIWDPDAHKPNKAVLNLAREAGVSVFRYGMGNAWDWKNAVGMNRKHLLFGIDEFMMVNAQLGSKADFTVSPIINDEKDAADLVEYLNSHNDGSNPNGGVDWAKEREKNGNASAYNVKYFEIGNEIYRQKHSGISAEEYVRRYLKFHDAMKAVDPSIMVGVNLPQFIDHPWIRKRKILPRIKNKFDFAIIHFYFSPDYWNYGEKIADSNSAFEVMLSIPGLVTENMIYKLREAIKSQTGQDAPLAFTEFNCWHPFQNKMGCALLTAELMKIFMKPENKILMANLWLFSNATFAMVESVRDFRALYRKNPSVYVKKPNYYMYELYNRHFGDMILDSEVRSDGYDVNVYPRYIRKLKEYKFSTANTHIPYLSVNASRNEKGDKVYLMVINKNMYESMKSFIEIRNFMSSQKADAWILNASSVNDENTAAAEKVKVSYRTVEGEDNIFEFTFEPHSLTALVFTGMRTNNE